MKLKVLIASILLAIIAGAGYMYAGNNVVETLPSPLSINAAPVSNIGDTEALEIEVNRYRANKGLNELVRLDSLDMSAKLKCTEMETLTYWSHDSPDGNEPWQYFDKVGIDYIKAGENLAYGQEYASHVVDQWRKSPGHDVNLSDPEFDSVGYYSCYSSEYVTGRPEQIIVQHLASMN